MWIFSVRKLKKNLEKKTEEGASDILWSFVKLEFLER